jgi:UDP-N-acetylglucosamine 3-dehydrogenase
MADAMLTVGLIGCGGIAQRAHVPALQRLNSMVHVVRVCDVRDEAARRVADAFQCAWTTEYREVVEDASIDSVVICTPEFLHAEQAVAAAHSGKHVLCEKPMARTLAEADSMIAGAESAHVRLMIAHSRRFTPRYQRAYELVQSGAVGEPVLVRENERRQRIAPAAPGVMPPGWRPDPTKETTWYWQARYAEGTVFHIGVHEMDLLRWFAGADAESVFMHSKISAPTQEVADTVTIQIRFRNGVIGACDIFNQAPLGYPSHHELEIIGTRGVVRSRDLDSLGLMHFDDSGGHFPSASESLLLVPTAYALEQQLFFQSILNDEPVPLDPHESRAALEMALAAVRSSESGERVMLPLAAC